MSARAWDSSTVHDAVAPDSVTVGKPLRTTRDSVRTSRTFMMRRFEHLLFVAMMFVGLVSAQTTMSVPGSTTPRCAGPDCQEAHASDQRQPNANNSSDRDRDRSRLIDGVRSQYGVESSHPQSEVREPERRIPVQRLAVHEEPSEFETFVRDSLGQRLSIFGANLFQDVPTTFAPVDRVPVPADYVIGPGDELLIRAWGSVDLQARVVVDRDGQVQLPSVGILNVAGLKYSQLAEYVKTSVGRVFRGFDLTVTLGQLRSIQVFVVGFARRPGSYTVSSLSTLVNTLFASGGPSARGSMRRIHLKRRGKVITEFDLYDLLLSGDTSKDCVLLPGDVIHIPPVGALVAISGSVQVPAIFETRPGTTFAELIDMAGGLANVASSQKITVERIDDRKVRRIEHFALDDAGRNNRLRDGDIVRVTPLSPRIENAVTLRGNVAWPGRYAWREGMRVTDLIGSRESLITRKFWNAQNSLFEHEKKPIGSSPELSASRREFPETTSESTLDARKRLSNVEIRNEAKRNGSEINWDYALIQRLDNTTLKTVLLPFNLGRALDGDASNDVLLQAGDVVTVFSQQDLQVPVAKQSRLVRLEGEFQSAGIYQAEPGETLKQLVRRVGLTPNSYLYGAKLTRESERQRQQEGLDRLSMRLEQEVERTASNAALRGTDQQAAVLAVSQRAEAQRNFVRRVREVRAEGRVVLQLQPNSTSIEDLPEIVLEDGDTLFVPYRGQMVEVLGAVYNQNSFVYREEWRLKDYLRIAGGGTKTADSGEVFVIRADGTVVSRRHLSWFRDFDDLRIYPGDSIVVPEKMDHVPFMTRLKDWSQVVSQFSLGAAAIRVFTNN